MFLKISNKLTNMIKNIDQFLVLKINKFMYIFYPKYGKFTELHYVNQKPC